MKQTLPPKQHFSQDTAKDTLPQKQSSINIVEHSYPDVIRFLKKQTLKPNPKVVEALLKQIK